MIVDYIVIAALYVVPVLFAIIIHEVSHGWVAEKLGDPTARLMGRITLNPIVHIDPIGTLLLPGFLWLTHSPFLFGWAKPVPVNFGNLRGGRKDMAMVGLAGPLSNFIMAALSSAIFHLSFPHAFGSIGAANPYLWFTEPVHVMARISVEINLVLMVINLLPIPPLDGGRIFVGLAPLRIAMAMERLERYGILILLLLIGSGAWSHIVSPVINFFWHFMM
jgi:Zn-dependent protease